MTNELTLICDACGKSVGGKRRGYLWVDRTAVERTKRAIAEWEQAHATTESGEERRFIDSVAIRDYPARVRWQAHHQACDPAPEEFAYDIDSDALRTWKQLLDWTADLMGKPWVRLTDWTEVLRGVHVGEARLVVAR